MNLLELFIKIGADDKEAQEALDRTEKSAEGATSRIGKLGSGLTKIGAMAAAGVGVAATAVAGLTKQATSAYGEYQQLAGGIETLYKDSAGKMMQYANQAFASAGMDVNSYMNTAIESSAAMISSLGGDTEKAAEMTNMAIIDMSDNVNKMGTSMESLQNAYRGFSRGNFTMLDNLSLGFAGTKEGMQQLLDKAEELSGVKYDINSYSDIVQAIHEVQTSFGITGTTAKEGAETITGSMAAVKAAWQNLITGLANPDADLGKLIDNVVDNAEVAFTNLIPTIQNALTGVANLVANIAPIIAEKLPGLVEQILPPLLSAATTLIQALVQNLPTILQILLGEAPNIITMLVGAILDVMPMIVDLGFQLITALVDGIVNSLDVLIPAAVDMIMTIVDKLTDPDTIVKLIDAALKIIVALAEGLMNAMPRLIEKVPVIIQNLITALVNALPKIAEAGLKILESIIGGILSGLPKIPGAIDQIKTSVTNGILNIVNSAKTWGIDLISNFISGIRQKFEDFKAEMADMAGTVKAYIGFSEPDEGPLSDFHTYAPDMMQLFADGIRDNTKLITDQINKSFDFSQDIIKPENNNALLNSNIPKSSNTAVNSASNVQVNVTLEGVASEILRVVRQETKKMYNSTGNDVVVYGG